MAYWLRELDRGNGHIDWTAIRKEVIKPGALRATSSELTASGHVALGVAMHTGRDKDAREFVQNVDALIGKPAYR